MSCSPVSDSSVSPYRLSEGPVYRSIHSLTSAHFLPTDTAYSTAVCFCSNSSLILSSQLSLSAFHSLLSFRIPIYRMDSPPPPPVDPVPAVSPQPDPLIPGRVSDTIEDETGEGLLLNDPLVMSMYQTASPAKPLSPLSSPDVSPIRPDMPQLAEESLSDKEFEQMEAAAAAATIAEKNQQEEQLAVIREMSESGDSGRMNATRYEISADDPFQTPAKAGTKSSDEDDYEVIPQGHEVSNLMSLSPSHSFAADTTIIEPERFALPDPEPEVLPEERGSPAFAPTRPAQREEDQQQLRQQTDSLEGEAESAVESREDGAPGGASAPHTSSELSGRSVASVAQPERETYQTVSQSLSDDLNYETEKPIRAAPGPVILSEPEPADPFVAAPAPALVPKKTPKQHEKTDPSSAQSVHPFVTMASADSSSATACPYVSGEYFT